ncbi:hypothetical protein BF29_2747 [Heyndrickxia coagulans DSM 1 = ATCC 7050]|nr:hypothetical protein BF29_2747 [Heyndrickxia coagulans DSM 1 = ATCC 7050]
MLKLRILWWEVLFVRLYFDRFENDQPVRS